MRTVAAGSSPSRVRATVLLNFTPPSFFSLVSKGQPPTSSEQRKEQQR